MKSNGLEGMCSNDLLSLVLYSALETADVEKLERQRKILSVLVGGKLGSTCPAHGNPVLWWQLAALVGGGRKDLKPWISE